MTEPAKLGGATEQDVARLAVGTEQERQKQAEPLGERIRAWRKANPFPPTTGLEADKAFFDDLSGPSG